MKGQKFPNVKGSKWKRFQTLRVKSILKSTFKLKYMQTKNNQIVVLHYLN